MKCKSLTLKGKKCKNDAIEGDFCRLHSYAEIAYTKTENINGMEIKTIPKDYFLFRAQNDFVSWGNWFSTRKIAKTYLRHHTRCNKYIATRDIRLVDVSDANTIHGILHTPFLSAEERHIVTNVTGYGLIKVPTTSYSLSITTPYTNKNPTTLAFAPVGYHSVDDFIAGVYINKRFAQIICKLEFDGWYIGHNKVQDTSLEGMTMFEEEVMLCNPQDVLERTMEAC